MTKTPPEGGVFVVDVPTHQSCMSRHITQSGDGGVWFQDIVNGCLRTS